MISTEKMANIFNLSDLRISSSCLFNIKDGLASIRLIREILFFEIEAYIPIIRF